MLKDLTEREIRKAAESADVSVLSEVALRVLYQRKAFLEATGMNEEHYPHGDPKPSGHGPGRHQGLRPEEKEGSKGRLSLETECGCRRR